MRGVLKDAGSIMLGADVIRNMIPERHPMIMVDRIIDYSTSPHQLFSERYVSANEPVFSGHFPDLKLWPGIYTMEGLRQSCMLLRVLQQLGKEDMEGLIALQKRQILQPKVDNVLLQNVLDTLQEVSFPEPSSLKLRIKLLAPVFAGCVIGYHVVQNHQIANSWSVQAEVNGQIVAEGEINQDLPDS